MRFLNRLLIWISAPLLLAAIACGVPGAPQPPSLQLPRAVENLSGERKGTRVVLTWTPPTQTTDRQNLRRSTVTRICRAVGEFPMANCHDVVKELPSSEITSQPTTGRAKPTVVYEDVLSPQVMGAQPYASYAVEVFNDRGRSAGLSNQVRIPLAPTLPAPTDLSAEVTPSGPVLHWTGSQRAQLSPAARQYEYRYRIYRRPAGQQGYVVVGEVPLDGPGYSIPDNSFEWEKTYDYKISALTAIPLTIGRTQTEVESDDSPIAHLFVHDTFPPDPPTGLQAVYSGVGQKPFIDLSWAPNTESDLAGYIVFRREAGQAPVALNSGNPAKAPAFRDSDVLPGRTYTYAVQAIDVRGNVSAKSEETSESVPGAER